MSVCGIRMLCVIVWAALGTGMPCVVRGQSGTQPAAAVPSATDVLARSLALEAQGDLAQARQVVVAAFGERPAAYEPCVRLAALSFQLRRSGEAVQLYRIARELPQALPEATLGLGLALTLHGYEQIDRGALGTARSDFLEALVIDNTSLEARKGLTQLGGPRGTGVDVMASTISMSAFASTFQLYSVHVPVRVDESLALRFAAQQLNAPDFAVGSTAVTATTQLFASVVRDIGVATVEGMGLLHNSSGSTTSGVASSARVGGSVGATASLAVIGLRSGTSVQSAPAVFAHLTRNLLVTLGARVTHDSQGTIISPIVALGLRSTTTSLDVHAHFGNERSAFSLALPAMQPYLGTSKRGVTSMLTVRVANQLHILAQSQFEQSDALGAFRNVGLGFRVVPR